jgi:hypothetical protein
MMVVIVVLCNGWDVNGSDTRGDGREGGGKDSRGDSDDGGGQ